MRVLLDTNIIFDLLCKRPFDEGGLTTLKIMHEFGDVELWASAKSYTDLFYVMQREIDSLDAQELLEKTFDWLKACSIEEDDVKAALAARWHNFEDCLVSICAEKVKADYLITRDKKGFAASSIPHGTASEFAEFAFEKTGIRYAMADEL